MQLTKMLQLTIRRMLLSPSAVLVLVLLPTVAYSFSLSSAFTGTNGRQQQSHQILQAESADEFSSNSGISRHRFFRDIAMSGFLAASLISASPVQASEIGVEVEAPTLYTGENVLICKKRGPLGACLETVERTDSNDNDKAKKYFADPSKLVKKTISSADQAEVSGEGNALIERLRQQTKDNAETNELEVQRKTFENNQSAMTGPFSRQVLIMNTDGKTFTLLDNPQAMRLKDAGFIKDRKFLKQPTEEELESYALAPEGGSILDGIQGIFGGGSN